MGTSRSSLLGRALAEVSHSAEDRRADSSHLPQTDAEWGDVFPDFACWAGDFLLPKRELFAFLEVDVMMAKKRHGCPMALFPSQPPGLDFTSAEPVEDVPAEERRNWKDAPEALLSLPFAMAVAEKEGLTLPLFTTTVLETVCHETHHRSVDVSLCQIGDEVNHAACHLEVRPVEDWHDLAVGDHVAYLDTEGHYVMEHHLIVVGIWPRQGTHDALKRPSVLCVGIMLRTRWVHASLTLIDLNYSMRQMRQEPKLLRLVAKDFHRCAPPFGSGREVAQAALACVGLYGVWFGSTMNCEDWANWICTGWSFSMQRMRAVRAMQLSATSLTHMEEGSTQYNVKDMTVPYRSVMDFCECCGKLRLVRLSALQALQTHENFF